MGNGVSMGGFTCGVFFFLCEVGEGGMTELAVVVSCLVVVLPSGSTGVAQSGSMELALSVLMPLRVAFLIMEVQLGSLIVLPSLSKLMGP